MADINVLIDELIQREGGYVDHPNDKGGPTRYGITEHVARAHGYGGPMQSLPMEFAREVYLEQYWYNPGFDKIFVIMPKLAIELFDTGVNMGPQTASRFLQRALNGLNSGATAYPDITVDGAIGRMTMFNISALANKRGRAKAELVLTRLCDAQQASRYLGLGEANAKQEDFMFGWVLNRVGE